MDLPKVNEDKGKRADQIEKRSGEADRKNGTNRHTSDTAVSEPEKLAAKTATTGGGSTKAATSNGLSQKRRARGIELSSDDED